MENTTVLDCVLSKFYTERTELHLASIDIQKAFDSIAHEALLRALESLFIPDIFIDYIRFIYLHCRTTLEFHDGRSPLFHPTVGVRQGDPLSPLLFNIALDEFLRSLPDTIGVPLGGHRLNAVAFADDMLLFVSTSRGMQELLDISNLSLGSLGLRINLLKSFMLSLVPSGRDKVKIARGSFRVGNTPIPHLGVDEEWTYLGVPFTPTGKAKVKILEHPRPSLEIPTKAPLKPQQRLFFLRCHLLPGVFHLLALGSATVSSLNKADTVVRSYFRKWLDLPVDIPVPYFYADVSDGSLGVPCLRWSRLRLRLDRLRTFTSSHFLNNRILALSSVDFYCFTQSSDFNDPAGQNEDSRGRPNKIRNCRAGYTTLETPNHVVQQCYRSHGLRIKRHNAISYYISRSLQQKGFQVTEEPVYPLTAGTLKPDLVALNNSALVLDVQVVGDSVELDSAHTAKIVKYTSLESAVKVQTGAKKVEFSSVTLNWRGVWSPASAK
nr:Retrovirus-related Pol polyprotein from type-2 retrotransposable element R2DM [Araneus ventricosus]